jgi:hypothetical protein
MKIKKGSNPDNLVCMNMAIRLLRKRMHNPQNRLFSGSFLKSLLVILKPSFSSPMLMIRVIVPAFRYGTRLNRNRIISSTVILSQLNMKLFLFLRIYYRRHKKFVNQPRACTVGRKITELLTEPEISPKPRNWLRRKKIEFLCTHTDAKPPLIACALSHCIFIRLL